MGHKPDWEMTTPPRLGDFLLMAAVVVFIIALVWTVVQ